MNSNVYTKNDYIQIARGFLQHCYTVDGKPTLHHSRKSFYVRSGNIYSKVSKDELYSKLYLWLSTIQVEDKEGHPTPFLPNIYKVGEVLHAITSLRQLSADYQFKQLEVESVVDGDDVTDIHPKFVITKIHR